jgi:alkyl hydroperoxide reductase subunit AhpC
MQTWIRDIKDSAQLKGADFPFPIIADETRELSKSFGLLDPKSSHPVKYAGLRCPAAVIVHILFQSLFYFMVGLGNNGAIVGNSSVPIPC